MTDSDMINLAQLPRELAKLCSGTPPSYRWLYARVLDGALPAEQRQGRWFVRRQDLPAIAERFSGQPAG